MMQKNLKYKTIFNKHALLILLITSLLTLLIIPFFAQGQSDNDLQKAYDQCKAVCKQDGVAEFRCLESCDPQQMILFFKKTGDLSTYSYKQIYLAQIRNFSIPFLLDGKSDEEMEKTVRTLNLSRLSLEDNQYKLFIPRQTYKTLLDREKLSTKIPLFYEWFQIGSLGIDFVPQVMQGDVLKLDANRIYFSSAFVPVSLDHAGKSYDAEVNLDILLTHLLPNALVGFRQEEELSPEIKSAVEALAKEQNLTLIEPLFILIPETKMKNGENIGQTFITFVVDAKLLSEDGVRNAHAFIFKDGKAQEIILERGGKSDGSIFEANSVEGFYPTVFYLTGSADEVYTSEQQGEVNKTEEVQKDQGVLENKNNISLIIFFIILIIILGSIFLFSKKKEKQKSKSKKS